MTTKSVLEAIWNALSNWFLMVPLIGFASGLFLYGFHGTEFATLFLVTIVAFIASDLLTPLFMRGGKGICQITLNGTGFKGLLRA